MSLIGQKRFQQGVFEALASANRMAGSGGGTGLSNIFQSTSAAGSNQGGYSTVNGSTWTDITNTTFNLAVSRPSIFLYFVYACTHITAGAQTGYIRGNIVGFDVSAKLIFDSANKTNGTMLYFPTTQGPLQPGSYTVKMQAATDANTTTITVDQFFHVILLF
jgi:hypothetical protein